jgi:hypothetical protein
MSPEVVWLGWLTLFLVFEIYAAFSPAKGDTLSENVWKWFRASQKDPLSTARRSVILAFMLSLTTHFVWGTSVMPIILLGAIVGGIIFYSVVKE